MLLIHEVHHCAIFLNNMELLNAIFKYFILLSYLYWHRFYSDIECCSCIEFVEDLSNVFIKICAISMFLRKAQSGVLFPHMTSSLTTFHQLNAVQKKIIKFIDNIALSSKILSLLLIVK